MAEILRADPTSDNDRRASIAKMAESDKLDAYFEESLIDQYAKAYGVDPEIVYLREFDSVFVFLNLWKQQGEYFDRYRAVEKAMNQEP